MSRIFRAACAAAVAATMSVAFAMTVPGLAQTNSGATVARPAVQAAGSPQTTVFVSTPVVQDLPVVERAVVTTESPRPLDGRASDNDDGDRANSLAELVRETMVAEAEDAQHRCLAQGVFYESRAESLEGQLAVAHVILNRARSGRFADTVCGVLTQRGQFSFVRGGAIPTPRDGAQWRTALTIAQIAMEDDWASPVPGALFFHATRVSPGWNRTRMGRIGNHIFYR